MLKQPGRGAVSPRKAGAHERDMCGSMTLASLSSEGVSAAQVTFPCRAGSSQRGARSLIRVES